MDSISMASKRLEAVVAARILDPNRAVARRRREPSRIVGEGYRIDGIAMALKCLEAVAAEYILDSVS